MNWAKEYLEKTVNGGQYTGEYYNEDIDQGTPKAEIWIDTLNNALELAYCQGLVEGVADMTDMWEHDNYRDKNAVWKRIEEINNSSNV